MRDPNEIFTLDRYLARRKVFSFLGGTFTIHAPDPTNPNGPGEIVAYVRQRAFRLREDIRVYSDETTTEEVLLIQARQVIDFSASYDVVVPGSGEKVGALRRKGFSSLFRDRWQILGAADETRGEIVEDSLAMAMVRRYLSALVPQRFHLEYDGGPVGRIRQRFNPFVLKYEVDFSEDPDRRLDRRVALAAVILLLAIEGRQD